MSKDTPARRLSSGTFRQFRAPKQRRILKFSRRSAVASGSRLLRTLAPSVATFVGFSPTGGVALSVCAVSYTAGQGACYRELRRIHLFPRTRVYKGKKDSRGPRR